MRTIYFLSLLSLIAIICSPSLSVAAKTPPTGKQSVLTATGEGAMPSASEQPNRAKAYLQAKNYAQARAVANLIQTTRGISIRYSSTGNGYAMDEQLSQEIEGMVEHVRAVSERKIQIEKDTVVEVTVEAPLPERWQSAAAAKSVPAKLGDTPSWQVASVQNVSAPTPTTFRMSKEERYTSLIIDAVGLKVCRAMSPKILRTDGSEVWGTCKVSYDFVADHGIVAYTRTIGESYANIRAGANPLVLRAVARGQSSFDCDVVLSDDDADYLLSENHRSHFLDDMRVIFLVDPI